MKGTTKIIASVILVMTLLLAIPLTLNVGCTSGNADILLEGLALGTVTMEGKTVSGLPSDKINLLLEVSAKRVVVNFGADGTTLTINPSGTTIEIKANSISIKGAKPEQIKVEWTTAK